MRADNDRRDATGIERCPDCGTAFGLTDSYCANCGAKRGERAFSPQRNVPVCVYGPPPVKRVHTCKKCGRKWTGYVMTNKDKFCPECGGEIETKIKK